MVNKEDEEDKTGFYCELCDVSCKDSSTFLDHVNG